MTSKPTQLVHMVRNLGIRGTGTMCVLSGPTLWSASITHCRAGVTCLQCLNALDEAEKAEGQ